MFSNKLAFTALGAACIMAASAGGYLAFRQNATSTATPVTAGPAERADSESSTQAPLSSKSTQGVAAIPVQETEAIASRTPAASAAKPAAAPAPAKAVASTTSSAPKGATTPAPLQASRIEAPATFDRPWPGNAPSLSTQPSVQVPPQAAPEPIAAQPRPGETVVVAQDPAPLPETPQKGYEELVVSADSVIGLQSETTVSSERARVEDRVEARVTRDVKVGNRVAIPAGSRAIGFVSQVERGGKFKEHARIAVRFQTVVLADGTRLPISTDAVVREGSAPSNESAKKIGGGAVAGTILGAILGGAKGAAIGGMAGAGAGAGVVATGERSAATLHNGEPITIRLLSPVTVTSER